MTENNTSKPLVGRPTDYKPEYCDQIMLLGMHGKSVVQFANHFQVVRKTLYEWAKIYPEFSDAFTRAKQYSQEWWESLGQLHIIEKPSGDRLNSGLYSRSMAARFPEDWRDKSDVNVGGQPGNPIGHTRMYIPDNGRKPTAT